MLSTLLNTLFPKSCAACSKALSLKEEVLCVPCRHQLPLASYHKTGATTIIDLFFGRVPLENATALIAFQKKGITQTVLHNLKYRKQEQISSFFGKWLGAELAEISRYKKIDIIIPVPLHYTRKRKRGYNQVTGFGSEIAVALNKIYREDILLKKTRTRSQVFKSRYRRSEQAVIFNLENISEIENKHILLVDDILTTGATLENCALELLKVKGVKISFAVIAITL
jgi:ComF family protein